MLQNVENNLLECEEYLEHAQVKMESAKEIQDDTKKKTFCLMCCMTVAAIIIVVLLSGFL